MSKQVYSTIMTLSLLMLNLTPIVNVNAAGENITINPASTSAIVNQADLVVPIYVNNVSDLQKIEFDLTYDEQYLEYTGYDPESDIGDFAKLGCIDYYSVISTSTPGIIDSIVSRGACGGADVGLGRKVIGLHFRTLDNSGTTNIILNNVVLSDSNLDVIEGITSIGSEIVINLNPTPQISIPTEIATEGDNVFLTVSASDWNNIVLMEMEVVFDETILTYVDFDPSNVMNMAGWDVGVDDFMAGTLNIYADSYDFDTDTLNDSLSGNMDVIILNFTAISSGTSDLEISADDWFTYLEDEMGPVVATWNNGSVVVEEIVLPASEINISSDSVLVGENISVTIDVSDVVDLVVMEAELTYDDTILNYINYTVSSELDDAFWFHEVDEWEPGILSIIADDDFGAGDLLNGSFDTITLNFSTLSPGVSNLEFTSDGFVTYLEELEGPVNDTIWNNGIITVIDNPEITVETKAVNTGDSVSIIVSATDLINASLMELEIVYDDSILSFVDFTPGPVLDLVFWDVGVNDWGMGALNIYADSFGGDAISGDVEIITLNFDTLITGTSNLAITNDVFFTYLEDTMGPVDANWVEGEVSVYPDLLAPIIILLGSSSLEVIQGDEYVDAGATALDNIDGDITDDIIIVNLVNTNILGEYVLNYNIDDAVGNSAIEVNRTVNVIPADTSAPVISNGAPSGTLVYTTTETELSVTTDENATCKYSLSDQSYDEMVNAFDQLASTTHIKTIAGLSQDNSYTYYVRCSDELDNKNNESYLINFSVADRPSSGGGGGGSYTPSDTTAPAQVSDLRIVRTELDVELTWINPSDTDFENALIVRMESEVDSFTGAVAARELGEVIYEGDLEIFIDNNIEENLVYYYLVYTYDEVPNYSNAKILMTSPLVVVPDDGDTPEVPGASTDGVKYTNLGGVESSIVEEVSGLEAKVIYEFDRFVDMEEIHISLYNRVVLDSDNEYLTVESKYSIAYFIRYGSDTTIILGAGERVGVVNSYKSVFSRLPQTEEEWKDVVKIANGRWPSEQNISAEQKAQAEIFKTIYKREANMDNANDNAAVTVITYGLRPADRNMDSEKAGIKIFESIMGYGPSSANDWDIVRAISYSGAVR